MPEKQQSSVIDLGDANAAVVQLPLPQHTASASITAQPPPHYLSSSLNSRLDRTTVCLPIVHGSVAYYLGKRAENKNEYQSHQWTLYLRGLNNEDLSTCIEKVVFQLHPSFAQPIREYKNPPFEVTEKGWGEFEAQIRIHWKDSSEQMTMLTHGIKLYPTGTSANVIPTSTEVPVVSEVYDEIVFTNPNESFFLDVLAISDAPHSIEKEYSQYQHFTKFSDTADMHALLEAQKFIQQQLQITKERYVRINEELEAVDIEIENAVLPPPPPPPPPPQQAAAAVPTPSSQPPVMSQPSASSTTTTAAATSKSRNNIGGTTKPRASTKGRGTGTKNNKATATQAQQSGSTTGNKKARTTKQQQDTTNNKSSQVNKNNNTGGTTIATVQQPVVTSSSTNVVVTTTAVASAATKST